MYQDTLRAIDGIAIFPVISLVLFVAVFATVLVRTARMDRRRLDRCAQLPFDEAARPRSDGPDSRRLQGADR